jgi:hypothetical protein
MKPSFHSRTLTTQLIRCHLPSIIFDCHLKRLPQLLFQPAWVPRYIASERTHRKQRFHRYPNITSIRACLFVATGTCLPSLCEVMDVSCSSPIPDFRLHVTVSCTTDYPGLGASSSATQHLECSVYLRH